MDKLALHDELAEADRQVAEGEARVTEQARLIASLAAGGHDTSRAEELLVTLEATLTTVCEHRELVQRAIAGAA
jgi:hypothetical protein